MLLKSCDLSSSVSCLKSPEGTCCGQSDLRKSRMRAQPTCREELVLHPTPYTCVHENRWAVPWSRGRTGGLQCRESAARRKVVREYSMIFPARYTDVAACNRENVLELMVIKSGQELQRVDNASIKCCDEAMPPRASLSTLGADVTNPPLDERRKRVFVALTYTVSLYAHEGRIRRRRAGGTGCADRSDLARSQPIGAHPLRVVSLTETRRQLMPRVRAS